MSEFFVGRGDGCGGFAAIEAAIAKDGAQRQRFRKELIKVGDYVKESTGQTFSVDAALLDHWAKTFSVMADNGVAVPMPSTHAGAGNPDKNRGYVKSMFVEGESLVMVCELIGSDAIAAAERNDVSIHSLPELVDGKGNKYSRPITHVALTPEPLVPGLGEFIAIAASLRMEHKSMNLKGMAKLLGIEGDVDVSNAEAKFSSAIKKLQSDLAGANKKLEKSIKASLAEEADADKGKDVVIQPMLLELARDNRTLKLDQLHQTGRIDKATHTRLSEQFVSADALTLALSQNEPGADGFDRLVETLKDNQPVRLGEHTGPQSDTITMSDGSKRSAIDVLTIDAEQRAEAAKV